MNIFLRPSSFQLRAYLLLAFLWSTCPAFAQTTRGLYTDSTGNNIGIGTTTPQTAFAVTNGNMGIGTWTADGGRLIVSGGNVGIGTTLPSQALAISGNLGFTNGPRVNDSSGKLQFQAGGTGTGSTGTGSIYFLDSSAVVRGRVGTAGSDVVTFTATGGTITTSGSNEIHTFNSSSTFTVTGSGNVSYLVVGGGGGGAAGGGGAGGMLTGTLAVTAQAYSITVGAGGTGGSSDRNPGTNGGDSVFSSVTATGGGRGAQGGAVNGSNGGSGGGAGWCTACANSGGTGTAGQGNNGGTNGGDNTPTGFDPTGGGGGAGAVGGNGNFTTGPSGNGGAGTASSISGSSVTYAGGGGGGGSRDATAGSGGSGGGGAGGYGTSNTTGTNGTANTGGGGGGGGGPFDHDTAAGNGGSGVVIISFVPVTSTYGTLFIGATNTSSADLAEYYVTADHSLEAGDVVCLSNIPVKDANGKDISNQGVLSKCSTANDPHLIGIISTNPGVILGSIDSDTGNKDKRLLALSGKVPTKVSIENGPIAIGDHLTSSSTPGVAMKQAQSGQSIGMALQDSSAKTDKISVFVNLGYQKYRHRDDGAGGTKDGKPRPQGQKR